MRRPAPSYVPAVLAAVVLSACAAGTDPSGPADAPSSAPSPSSAAAVDRVEEAAGIPNDFPLTSGWKAGLEAPRRGDADLPLCGDGTGDPPNANASDRLVASWSKRARARQVTLYPDAAAASGAVRDLLAYYRGCPTAGYGELPWRGVTTVRRTDGDGAGDGADVERWEVLQTIADRDGVFGGSVLQVVRVRRAVLLDVAGGLGEGPRWERRARTIAADQVTWGAGVVAAMAEL